MEENKIISTDELLEITNNDIIDVNVADVENVQDIEDDTPDLVELEFKPIREIIQYRNKEGKIKRVKIYNVDNDKNNELMKIIMQYSTLSEDGQVNTDIPPFVVLSQVMRILTNIRFPEDEEQINKIIENPDDYLKKTQLIVADLLKTTLENNFKSLEMTKDTLEKMGLTDEKILELSEKQKEISKLTILAEKEKQETEKIKIQNNDDIIKEMAQKINKLEVEKLEALVENEKLKEVKPKRKYNKKKKAEEVVDSKTQ